MLFFHIMNNTVFIAKRETNSHMGYSDFFGHHFIITKKRFHFFAETAVTFGLDQNPFYEGQKTSQTGTLKSLFVWASIVSK